VFDQPINNVGLDGVALQDYGSTHLSLQNGISGSPDAYESESSNELISFHNDIADIHSSVQLLTLDGSSTIKKESLKATSNALSLVKDRINDLQLSASVPTHLQGILKETLSTVTNAEKHVQKIYGFASKYYGLDGEASKSNEESRTRSRRRILSQGSSAKHHFSPSVTKADYHSRAKSQSMNGIGNHFTQKDHQQGYHRARTFRQEGRETSRRLTDDDGATECVDVDEDLNKKEQCLRLAECSKNYNLYDLFVFLFSDDIMFDSGKVDPNEKIRAFDEKDGVNVKVRLVHLSFAFTSLETYLMSLLPFSWTTFYA